VGIFRTEQCLVGWAPETVFGTAVIANRRFGLHETVEAPDPEMEWTPFWGVAAGRSRSTILRGRWTLRGSIPDIRIRQGDPLGELLAMAIGRLEGKTVREGRTPTDERLNSFTMQIAMRTTDGPYGLIRVYYGGKINRMTLSANEGEELRLSLDEMIFKDVAHSLPGVTKEGTPSLMQDPGPHGGGRFLFAGARILVGSVPLCRVRRLSLSLDNQIEPRYYLCRAAGNPEGAMTQVPADLVEGRRRWTATVELDVGDPSTDLELFKWFMNEGATGGDRRGTSGPTIGTRLIAEFALTPGEGSGSLRIVAGGVCTPSRPGAVVTSGRISVPAPPAGLFPSTWQLDVDTVEITLP